MPYLTQMDLEIQVGNTMEIPAYMYEAAPIEHQVALSHVPSMNHLRVGQTHAPSALTASGRAAIIILS